MLGLCGCALYNRLFVGETGPAPVVIPFTGLYTDGGIYVESSYSELFADPEFSARYRENVNFEKKYNKIEAYTEYKVYPADFDEISYTVKNNNFGKVFFVWEGLYIEHREGKKWERFDWPIPMDDIDDTTVGWVPVGLDASKEDYFSITLTLYYEDIPDWIASDIGPGDYRLALYTGDEIVYAEFSIE